MCGEDSAAMAAICATADIPASRTVQTLPLTVKTDSVVHSQRLQTSEFNFYPLVEEISCSLHSSCLSPKAPCGVRQTI